MEQILFKGSPGVWSVDENTKDQLPAGVDLDAATGQLTGSPTVYGTFEVTIKLVNDCGEATRVITIISCGAPEICEGQVFEYDVDLHDDCDGIERFTATIIVEDDGGNPISDADVAVEKVV